MIGSIKKSYINRILISVVSIGVFLFAFFSCSTSDTSVSKSDINKGKTIHNNDNKKLEDINTFLLCNQAISSRERRLLKIIKPDLIYRAFFEWVGTSFAENGWRAAENSIKALKDDTGALLIGGVSGAYWNPSIEKGPATINESTMRSCIIDSISFSDIKGLNISRKSALDHLAAKLKTQIDAGADGVDLVGFGDHIDKTIALESMEKISYELKWYAKDKLGKNLIITSDSVLGGLDSPQKYRHTGSEPVDLYIDNMPFRIIGYDSHPNEVTEEQVYNGGYNSIPEYRQKVQQVWPKRYIHIMKYDSVNSFGGPKTIQQLLGWYRISSAQSIASGAFPAHMRTYYNGLQDPLGSGMFHLISGTAKFLKENKGLWHDLDFISPRVKVSNKNVFTSAFGQPANSRTVLHVVNGNYDEMKLFNRIVKDVEIRMESDKKPSRVWMTTMDKHSDERRSMLDYSYKNGYVVFGIPELEVHAIIVFEYDGAEYNPQYEPVKVVMPFPERKELPASNTSEFTAVMTEGITGEIEWYVNDVKGGNDKIGTIDQNGKYSAPGSIQEELPVVIKAQSKERASAFIKHQLRILPALSLTWKPSFTAPTESDESIPGFEIVKGRGDWRVANVNGKLELSSVSAIEGFGNGDITETAQYPPFIITGDQTWSDYKFSFQAKRNGPTLNCYNDLSGTGIGIIFRYLDSKNYYMYFIDEAGGVRFVKVIEGKFTVINSGNQGVIPLDDIYTKYTVEVRGNKFYLYNFENLVSINSDTDITRGAVGLKTSYISCNFSDMSVSSIE